MTANGVSVSFSGGEGGRKSIILAECTDVEKPFLVSWTEGPRLSTYVVLVRKRQGALSNAPAQCRERCLLVKSSHCIRCLRPAISRETSQVLRSTCP